MMTNYHDFIADIRTLRRAPSEFTSELDEVVQKKRSAACLSRLLVLGAFFTYILTWMPPGPNSILKDPVFLLIWGGMILFLSVPGGWGVMHYIGLRRRHKALLREPSEPGRRR